MVVSSSNSYFSICLLLPCLFSTIIFAENDLITETCKQAINSSLCSKSLTSDPRSPHADLQTLGLIAIEKAQASAKSTRKLIESLEKSITISHTVKEIYGTCLEIYEDAIDSLISSKDFLESQDFKSLNLYTSAVITDATTCETSFYMVEGAAGEPPKIVEAGQELKDLADVILVISNKLGGE